MDNRNNFYASLKHEPVILAKICRSLYGQQVDGVIFLEKSSVADIKMIYFNADGKEVAMCGNGVRSVAHYFYHYEKRKKTIFVETLRKVYRTSCLGDCVSIEMTDINRQNALDISSLFHGQESFYVEVGVPHCVFLVDKIKDEFLQIHAPSIRKNKIFLHGANVNFVEIFCLKDKEFMVRTFEKGVERETLSCCTGITASALALAQWMGVRDKCMFHTPGGPIELVLKDPIVLKGQVEEYSKSQIDTNIVEREDL